MSADPLLRVTGLRKAFGGVVANSGVDLEVARGELHALIGPNGAGKTTLVAQLSGLVRPDAGRIELDGRDITRLGAPRRAALGLARSFQITSVFMELSALDNVALAVQAQLGHSFRFWRHAGRDQALLAPARAQLERVGLVDRAGEIAINLSHGERRQLELAMALASRPRLLVLDEPTAGMGGEDSRRMTELLASLKGAHAVLLVEHDMDVVFSLADRITVLIAGRALVTGTPAAIRADARVREAYLGDQA